MPLPAGIILGIETSNPSAWTPDSPVRPGVALARSDGQVLDPVTVEPIDLDHPQEDDLLPAIDRACRRAGVSPRALRGVAVSIGPGGFTAVRIAVAAGKMIAEATGAACWSVPTAHAVARRTSCGGPFAVALASKGETAWITVFAADLAPAPGRLSRAEDLRDCGARTLIADCFLPESFRQTCVAEAIPIQAPVFDPLAVIEAAAGLDAIDPMALVPLYPREPEAVTKWRERKGREGGRNH